MRLEASRSGSHQQPRTPGLVLRFGVQTSTPWGTLVVVTASFTLDANLEDGLWGGGGDHNEIAASAQSIQLRDLTDTTTERSVMPKER